MALRLTRVERQDANRRLLVDAAATLFRRHGFAGTSVAAVAAKAGLTTGAVYSNFDGKEDLFLAVLDRHYAERTASLVTALEGADSLDAVLDRVADWFAGLIREENPWPLMMVEFAAHARSSAALRRALADRHRLGRDALAALLAAEAARYHLALPERPEVLASAIFGLGLGLVVQQTLSVSPDETADVFRAALRALLGV